MVRGFPAPWPTVISMAKDIPPPNKMFILEMGDYLHCWHQCGPGATYACLSKDKSQEEIGKAVDLLMNHMAKCTGPRFLGAGDTGG